MLSVAFCSLISHNSITWEEFKPQSFSIAPHITTVWSTWLQSFIWFLKCYSFSPYLYLCKTLLEIGAQLHTTGVSFFVSTGMRSSQFSQNYWGWSQGGSWKMSKANSSNDSSIKLHKKQFQLKHFKGFFFSQWRTRKFVAFHSDFDWSQTLKSPE